VTRGDDADPSDALVTVSARVAFDLALEALVLKPGDEVLFTPTVDAMTGVARDRGLVVRCVDVDPVTLAPDLDSLERAVGPRTRVLVVAHLFGAHVDVGPAVTMARERGLVVVEDCAQSFDGSLDAGHPLADVVLFSFGTLKTATACGGGVARVRDETLRTRMRWIERGWPMQSTTDYLRRVAVHAALRGASTRLAPAALLRAGPSWMPALLPSASVRARPCAALVRVLSHRLRTFDPRAIDARRHAARELAARLPPGVEHVGGRIADHVHWAFPVVVERRELRAGWLRRWGHRATRRLLCFGPLAPRASALLSHVVFLPFAPAGA